MFGALSSGARVLCERLPKSRRSLYSPLRRGRDNLGHVVVVKAAGNKGGSEVGSHFGRGGGLRDSSSRANSGERWCSKGWSWSWNWNWRSSSNGGRGGRRGHVNDALHVYRGEQAVSWVGPKWSETCCAFLWLLELAGCRQRAGLAASWPQAQPSSKCVSDGASMPDVAAAAGEKRRGGGDANGGYAPNDGRTQDENGRAEGWERLTAHAPGRLMSVFGFRLLRVSVCLLFCLVLIVRMSRR
jgi:hypothetical protein